MCAATGPDHMQGRAGPENNRKLPGQYDFRNRGIALLGRLGLEGWTTAFWVRGGLAALDSQAVTEVCRWAGDRKFTRALRRPPVDRNA